MRRAAALGLALTTAAACGPVPFDILIRFEPLEFTEAPDGQLCAPAATVTGDVSASAPGAVTPATCLIVGNVTVDADVEGASNPFAGVREVRGDVVIQPGFSGGVLPQLELVSGHLHVKGVTTRAGAGALSKLREVGRLTVEDTTADGLAGLTALEKIATNVRFFRVPGAGELEALGSLEEVGGDFVLMLMSGLTGVSGMARLARSSLTFMNSPDLETVTLPASLTRMGALSLIDCPQVTTVSAPNVALMSSMSFNRNAKLRSASFPALKEVESRFRLDDNPLLETLEMPVIEELPTTITCRNGAGLADDLEAINARIGRTVLTTCQF